MRNIGKRKKNSRIKELILSHIKNNLREYAIITIIFFIGLVFGVVFVNNANEVQVNEISSYIHGFVDTLKSDVQIDKNELLISNIISNLVLVLAMWFVGSTLIGIPIVYGIVVYRGFCLGYTISSIVATLGIRKRLIVYSYINFISKYIIHTMYTCFSC